MKSGTAHKMVLNMLSTCVMIKYGRVLENYMIYIKPMNVKLKDRMIRIVSEIANITRQEAEEKLNLTDWDIKRAIESKEG
jgi:N-acetylmuramic acid 6-phosphate etherase